MRRFLHFIFVVSILGYGAWVATSRGAKRQRHDYWNREGFRWGSLTEHGD